MNQEPFLLFTPAETELMYNASVFPLKQEVSRKLYILFEHLKNSLKDTAIHRTFDFPAGTDTTTGKISKGENYEQQPYVILDFPRLFRPVENSTEIFAFRSLFWFGNYFSFSLLLAGKEATDRTAMFLKNVATLHKKEIYFSTHPDPWKHKTEEPYAVLIDTLSEEEIRKQIEKNGYIKISRRLASTDPQIIIDEGCKMYGVFLGMLDTGY